VLSCQGADVAGELEVFDMDQSTTNRCPSVGEWEGATWHPVIGLQVKILMESTGVEPGTSNVGIVFA